MKIPCELDFTTNPNHRGILVDCVIAVCTRCEHTTESFGTHDASIKRCLVLMREECPYDEQNFYIEDEETAWQMEETA